MVQRVPFGQGFFYRITDGETSVDIVPQGGSLRAIRVPDRAGRIVDVCLGYDIPHHYRHLGGCLGALVGPYANRISGASFTLNGEEYHLQANEGENTLHSGKVGFHHTAWDLSYAGEQSVLCTIEAADGEGGFPGSRRVEVTYTWQGGALTIDYKATSNRDTVINLTNHVYFNLAGQGEGTVEDHVVTIAADRYTPAGPDNVPTGELRDVTGTAWDLRQPTLLAERLRHPDLAPTAGFDQNFVLNGTSPAQVRGFLDFFVLSFQNPCKGFLLLGNGCNQIGNRFAAVIVVMGRKGLRIIHKNNSSLMDNVCQQHIPFYVFHCVLTQVNMPL